MLSGRMTLILEISDALIHVNVYFKFSVLICCTCYLF